jgi:hypothetical protein
MNEAKFRMEDEELTGTCPAIVAHYYFNKTPYEYDLWKIEATNTEKRRQVHNSGVNDETSYRKTAVEKIAAKVKRMEAIRGKK